MTEADVGKKILHFDSITFVQNFCSLSCSQNKALVHLENIRSCACTGDPALLGTNHQRQRGVLSVSLELLNRGKRLRRAKSNIQQTTLTNNTQPLM